MKRLITVLAGGAAILVVGLRSVLADRRQYRQTRDRTHEILTEMLICLSQVGRGMDVALNHDVGRNPQNVTFDSVSLTRGDRSWIMILHRDSSGRQGMPSITVVRAHAGKNEPVVFKTGDDLERTEPHLAACARAIIERTDELCVLLRAAKEAVERRESSKDPSVN